MWPFFSAMFCTMLYVLVAQETTVFEPHDPVFLVRNAYPQVAPALYTVCVIHMFWNGLGFFRMKTCFIMLAIVMFSMVVGARYLVHLYTDILIKNVNDSLGSWLDMAGLGSAMKVMLPPLNTWTILKQSWSYSAFCFDWFHYVFTLPRLFGEMPNNCCFVFSIVHYTAAIVQM